MEETPATKYAGDDFMTCLFFIHIFSPWHFISFRIKPPLFGVFLFFVGHVALLLDDL